MAWVAVIGATGAIAGGLIANKGSKQSGTQTSTTQQQLDPRIASAIFGNGSRQLKPGVTGTWSPYQFDENGNNGMANSRPTNPDSDYTTDSGLIGRYTGMLDNPQNAAMKQYGADQQQFLAANGAGMASDMHQTANNLMGGNVKAQGMTASNSQGSQINAPTQNGMNLAGSYDGFINGDRGGNTRLTQATQGAINQSTNQFRQMQGEATDNLMRNIMPGIRSNAVLAGQYGGSRQGVAEGNAISDFTRQQAQAQTQFGQNNTNQAVGAQAAAYETDSNRALSATQGLGAQQYGVAQQNASMGQQNNQFNASLQQSAAAQNVNSQLQTDQLNTARQTAGIAANSGLLNNAYAAGQNQDSYALNQAGKINGLLTPYLSANESKTTSQPLYENKLGNAIGGATMGLGLGQQIGKFFGNGGFGSSAAGQGQQGAAPAGTFYDGYGYVPK